MNPRESLAVFIIAATVCLSFLYFFILELIKRDSREKSRHRLVFLYLLRKLSGFLLLGAVPALAAVILFRINPVNSGLTAGNTLELWPWISGAQVIIIFLNSLNSKGPDLQAIYPELRLPDWNISGLAIALGGWIIYLAGYEFLFRGLLLYSCFDAFGLWPAVVINLAIYSALHLPKGLKEATAAIPFGALLCYLTLESNSILPAIIIHSVQAISMEFFCIHRNPGMNFHLTKSSQP